MITCKARVMKKVSPPWTSHSSWFWLLLYAYRHRSILEAAGHIILTLANQLMIMGLKIRSLSNPGFERATFRSLANALAELR
jgi:hypothetical protein